MKFYSPLYDIDDIIASDTFSRLMQLPLHNESILGVIRQAVRCAPTDDDDGEKGGVIMAGIYVQRADAPSECGPYKSGDEDGKVFVGAVVFVQTRIEPSRVAVFISHPDPDSQVLHEDYDQAVVDILLHMDDNYISLDEIEHVVAAPSTAERIRSVLDDKVSDIEMRSEHMARFVKDVLITRRRNLVRCEVDGGTQMLRITYPTTEAHHVRTMNFYKKGIREVMLAASPVEETVDLFMSGSTYGTVALVTVEQTNEVVAVVTIDNQFPRVARIGTINVRDTWASNDVIMKCMPHLVNHVAALRAQDNQASFPVSLSTSTHPRVVEVLRDIDFHQTNDETTILYIVRN